MLGAGIKKARAVRAAIGYHHPTELPIEVLAHMRGALVRPTPTTGARANVMRAGERAIISVAADLEHGPRRWAISHEVGHLETHPSVNYVGLCTGEDLVADYLTSGREPEANAFAAELLMPEDLYEKRCDVRKVSWDPIKALADDFQVSLTAAAFRFVDFTYDRVAVFICKDGVVKTSKATRDFGQRLKKGDKLDQLSLAYDFFKKGSCGTRPETISACAWVPNARDDSDLIEHVFPMPGIGMVLSLLWFPAS